MVFSYNTSSPLWGIMTKKMKPFLYNFFHEKTNDKSEGGLVNIPKDKNLWPKSWTTVFYRSFFSFKEILLPKIENDFLLNLLNRRNSRQENVLKNKITIQKLSYLLKCGYGLQDITEENKNRREHRTVPSGGKRYPMEIYIVLFREVESLKKGIYHYNIRNHSLEPVFIKDFPKEEIISFFTEHNSWLENTNGFVCMTTVFNRTIEKYGSRGYRYILLEAGHIAQNMILSGVSSGINMIPMAGVKESFIEKILGLGKNEERVVYGLFL